MNLRHNLPAGVDALMSLTEIEMGQDPFLKVVVLCRLNRPNKRGQVMYYRFKIEPFFEDWQDAIRQVYEGSP